MRVSSVRFDPLVKRRQWRESQRLPDPGIGQSNAKCTDDNRCCDKGRTSSALQEGNLRSAYDMDDERLRQQGLYNPPVWNSDGLFQQSNT